MNLIKSLKDRKTITLFFILSFTIGILIFSIGNSAIVRQNNKVKDTKPENNQLIGFNNYEGVTLDEIMQSLKGENLTVKMLVADMSTSTGIETIIIPPKENLRLDMKSGKIFSKDELQGDDKIGLYSSMIDGEFEISSLDGSIKYKIKKVGSYYEQFRRVTIPNKLFREVYGKSEVNSVRGNILLRGEPSDINKEVENLELALKKKNIKDGIEKFSLIVESKQLEGETLYNASILIFIITIINSVSISSLWVKSRKKEIVLRKVFGAKDIDIVKIFFGELIIIAIISLILALTLEYIFSIITGGFISTMDTRLNVESIFNSFIISIITALAVSIPSFMYISKIQPAEMLKGD